MKKKLLYCLPVFKREIIGLLLVLLVGFVSSKSLFAQRFIHPSIPFTRYDLDQLKANITQEPWLSAYNVFANDSHSKLTYSQQGPYVNVSRAPNLNNTKWQQDMIAVHHLAFMWVFTGDSTYARKATNLLDAWATTNTVWGGTESMLDIGDYADYWATGADILRGTFPNWTAANTQHVKDYFANVLYPTSFVPYQLRDANKGAIQLKIALGVAAFNDDATKFNEAIDVYRIDAGGGLRNSLTNGEVGDAGRDDHWRVQVAALLWGAEVAFKQGVDLYTELNNRVLAIGELYHKYAFVGNTLTFIPMGGYSSFWTNWGIQPGARRGDYTNIIKAAYSLRKGIATPYTDTMQTALGGAGGDFLFLKISDTSTALTLPPVDYPAENAQPVSLLTNLDIGNPGVAGGAAYDNGTGTWTLNGAGNSLSTSMNYTFKKIKGDAGLVVKVTGMSLTTGGSGVMIRQSLAPGSAYWNVQLGANGGVGAHYQPKAPWWLKIERVGNRIFTYHSPDGMNWTGSAVSYSASPRPDSLYYGLYTISNNNTALNTATFTNVAFSAASPTGSPEFTSATAADGIINTAFTYNSIATNGHTAFAATGLPAGLTIDNTTGIISGTPTVLGTSTVTLTGTNASGSSTHILIIRITNDIAPAAPTGATATVVNTSQIRLNWTASVNATTYSIQRSLTSGGPYTTIATGITGITYTDISPTPEVPNYYIITALAGTLESGVSNEVNASVPPSIPGKPIITLQNGQLKLDWQPAAGAVTYNVKRSSVMGGPYTIIANVSATTYTDAAVTNGSSYYYVISSVGTALQSGNSPEAFGVPGASTYTWAPSPLTENWSDAGNWMENATPASPAILTFKSTDDSTITNNITNLNVFRILFDTTASSYTISGNSLLLGNDMVNSSAAAQVVNTPLVLNNDYTVYANTQSISLAGLITGTGSITRTGVNALYVTGSNTYSGNTIVSGAAGGWPVNNGLAIAGTGTGTPGLPIAGPLGTGKIYMNGGALYSEGGAATLYNDMEAVAGKSSYLFQTTYALNLRGRLSGSGTIRNDGNTTQGLHLYGDNSGFTGTFINVLRSGNVRLRFEVPESGSANASWNLDASGVDCQSFQFSSGTISFGALSGRGYFRCNGGGTPIMSIGALNISTTFQGTINNSNGIIGVEKVGTANLIFTGNHTYTGATIIRNGRFLLNNDPSVGAFNSPLTAVAGAFGGTGRTTSAVTIGTGSGTGAMLEPGNLGIGTFTTTSILALKQDVTYTVEINASGVTSDKIIAGSVVLTNPQLSPVFTVTGTLPLGTNFTIIDNTSADPVTGTFNSLPELSLITVGGYDFRITYKGGTGNDVVLLDNRTIPPMITSSGTASGLVGIGFNYTITAFNAPYSFNATGLPPGLDINTTTGLISGIPTTTGTYSITITATTASGTATGTLNLNIYANNNIAGAFAAGGDARVTIEWDAMAAADTFLIKRSTTAGGPYTTIAKSLTNRYIDATIMNGTTYYYVISALTGIYEGANSTQVIASPNTGQVDYFTFDETSGTKSYDYWGANHANLMSGTTRVTGKVNQAIRFDGTTNSYATVPAGIASNLSTFTIAFWVNVSSLVNWARAFDFGNAGTTRFMYFCPKTPTAGKVRYGIRNAGTEQSLDATYTFVANTWTHVTITYAFNTASIYINGTLVGSSSTITIKPSDLGITANNNLGKATGTDPNLTGSLDEFRIYNRTLSASEISALYNPTILPVALTNYTAKSQGGSVLLNWTTATEMNNSYYLIEWSSDGIIFKNISSNIAAKNTSGASYGFTDSSPARGTNYYRLKQVDKDGKTTDLGTRLINLEGKIGQWIVYPNPAKGTIILKANNRIPTSNAVFIKLVNATGISVLSKKLNSATGNILSIDISGKIPAGNYTLIVNEQDFLPVIIVR